MYRATTPKHIFAFDANPEELFEVIEITYVQNGSKILQKSKEDLTFDEEPDCCGMYTCWLRLTQEETKLFDADQRAIFEVQLRAKTYGGDVVAFPIVRRSVEEVLSDEVLT